MSNSPYLDRLSQHEARAEASQKGGLPLNRPMAPNNKEMLGIPQEEAPKENPMEKAMETQFGMNLKSFSESDPRFQDMMKEYTRLANGLKQEVKSGYMPLPIAQRKLQQFLQDSSKYFTDNEKAQEQAANPEMRQMLEGVLAQAAGSGAPQPQAPMPNPEGQPIQPPAPTPPQMGGMQ